MLIQAGLLSARHDRDAVEIEATDDLRQLFRAMPELERLYPVLVECVMNQAQERRGFIAWNRAQTDRQLRLLGMTETGLWRLNRQIQAVVGTG